ncbi:hypothetical protein NB712_003778 [Xanthomonas sacchari]|nr:hypothetical protein [Xanthomonas sacchari]
MGNGKGGFRRAQLNANVGGGIVASANAAVRNALAIP